MKVTKGTTAELFPQKKHNERSKIHVDLQVISPCRKSALRATSGFEECGQNLEKSFVCVEATDRLRTDVGKAYCWKNEEWPVRRKLVVDVIPKKR